MMDQERISFFRLGNTPVLGVPMGNVHLLRLDTLSDSAPGNKVFKLRENLRQAVEQGQRRVLSFGGAWSNHLHALAAVGRERGLETVGIIRGDETSLDTPMLQDVQRWGMTLVRVSREEYRRRHDPAYQREVLQRFGPGLLIPEGGANAPGVLGCRAIGEMIAASDTGPARVVLAVGTGTTLAGIASQLESPFTVTGISALKGAHDLEQRVVSVLEEAGLEAAIPWEILHDHHCGGFARVSQPLREFMLAFEQVHRVPLEPVYTGKMMFAIHGLLGSGVWRSDEPLLAVHTGGLQGRRGYQWLVD